MFLKCSTTRDGYIVLITVLTVGVVSAASAIAILLLGLSVERNAFAAQISTQAFGGAWTCAERAIASLREDTGYTGDEDITFSYSYADLDGNIQSGNTTCTIHEIQGSGNTNRTICTEATFGNFTTRRLEITLSQVLPATEVNAWDEVSSITECPTS